MPGVLYHTPARIVKQLLIDLGLGADPDATLEADRTPWPVYRGREPDRPDDLIKVSDSTGPVAGDTMVDSECQERGGFQVTVRSADPETGYRKAQEVAVALDRVRCATVSLPLPAGVGTNVGTGTGDDYSLYFLSAIKRTTNVISIPTEVPQSKRTLYTVNFHAPFRLTC